jgi:hypothetical protein
LVAGAEYECQNRQNGEEEEAQLPVPFHWFSPLLNGFPFKSQIALTLSKPFMVI